VLTPPEICRLVDLIGSIRLMRARAACLMETLDTMLATLEHPGIRRGDIDRAEAVAPRRIDELIDELQRVLNDFPNRTDLHPV